MVSMSESKLDEYFEPKLFNKNGINAPRVCIGTQGAQQSQQLSFECSARPVTLTKQPGSLTPHFGLGSILLPPQCHHPRDTGAQIAARTCSDSKTRGVSEQLVPGTYTPITRFHTHEGMPTHGSCYASILHLLNEQQCLAPC